MAMILHWFRCDTGKLFKALFQLFKAVSNSVKVSAELWNFPVAIHSLQWIIQHRKSKILNYELWPPLLRQREVLL